MLQLQEEVIQIKGGFKNGEKINDFLKFKSSILTY